MSKIAEYTNAPTPLSGNDKLVGSSAGDENSTRNFTLDELNDYFSASINPPTPYTLQDILNNGNSATEDIVLTGNVTATRVITPNIQDINGTTGTTNQILSKSASGIAWINNTTNNLQNVLNNGNTATQNIVLTGNITSTRSIPTNIQDVVGSIGTTNQILTKGVSGITWTTPSVNNLQVVLDNGNTATQSITLTGTITATKVTPVNIQDVNASVGSTNQILSKGASGIVWTSLPTNTLQTVLNAGSSATQNIVLTGNITSTRIIPANIQDGSGSIGTAGQVLTKGASGISWTDPSVGAVNQIIAGTNVTISPAGGTGTVTINATTSPNQNLQSVLNSGNTATQNIVLTGNITSTISIPTNIQDVNASIGSTNQILSKGASGIVWINQPTWGLQSVLDTNNNATQNINLIGTINATKLNATDIQDSSASTGTANQILSKSAFGLLWINQATPTLQAVLNSNNVATQSITLVGDISATKVIPTNIQDITASTGTSGQVLSKGASGITWLTLPTANLQYILNLGNTATQNINLTGDITATKVIPTNIKDVSASTGNVGQVLSKGASGVLWIDLPNPPTPPTPEPTPPAGLSGYIQYNDGTNFAGDAELFFDSTLKYLGVGTNDPQARIHAYNIDTSLPIARFENSSTFKIDLLAADEALQGNYSAAIGAIGNSSGVLYANIDGDTEWRRIVRPYRSFVALLSWDALNEQTVLTELENDGFSISFTRTSQGVFLLEDTSGPFLENKTSLFVMQSNNSGNGGSGVVNVYFGRSGDDTLGIQVYDLDASNGSNTLQDILNNVSIEIRVYP